MHREPQVLLVSQVLLEELDHLVPMVILDLLAPLVPVVKMDPRECVEMPVPQEE